MHHAHAWLEDEHSVVSTWRDHRQTVVDHLRYAHRATTHTAHPLPFDDVLRYVLRLVSLDPYTVHGFTQACNEYAALPHGVDAAFATLCTYYPHMRSTPLHAWWTWFRTYHAINAHVDMVRICTRDDVHGARLLLAHELVPLGTLQQYAWRATAAGSERVLALLLHAQRVAPLRMEPLFMAGVEHNKPGVCAMLLQHGADPSVQNSHALCYAAKKGFHAIVQLLLDDNRSDPSVRDSYPLRVAASRCHVRVVQQLLAHGRVDPVARDHYCLRMASAAGCLPVVRLLLAHHADVRIPLRDAVEQGHADVVEALLAAHGQHALSTDTLVAAAAARGHARVVALLAPRARCYDDAVCAAAAHGHVRVVEQLVHHGADPATRNNDPLRAAARAPHLATVRYLLAFEAVQTTAWDVVLDAYVTNKSAPLVRLAVPYVHQPDDALARACAQGSMDVVHALLAHHGTRHHDDVLRAATAAGCADIVRMVLPSYNGDVQPYMDRAVRGGYVHVVHALLDHGATVHHATVRGARGPVLEALLPHVARSDMDAWLTDAVQASDTTTATLLLRHHRADTSPLMHIAVDNHDAAMVALLLRHDPALDVRAWTQRANRRGATDVLEALLWR